MERNILLENYLKSLEQKYNAVCFDIDGTLTAEGSKNIDDRAIGMIILGFGIVQVGLSLKSHDPSQRANGFLTVAGGIIITFAKEILNMIAG